MACELKNIYMDEMCSPVGGGGGSPYIIQATIVQQPHGCYEYTLESTMGEILEHIGETMFVIYDTEVSVDQARVLNVMYYKDDSEMTVETTEFGLYRSGLNEIVGIKFVAYNPEDNPTVTLCDHFD